MMCVKSCRNGSAASAMLACLATLSTLAGLSCGPTGPHLPTERVSSSFVFDEHALGFSNFGGVVSGAMLEEDHLARMFGKEAVCLPTPDDECSLTPIAKDFRRAVNKAIRGGRCEGFAILSGLVARGEVDIAPLGIDSLRSASLDDASALGGEIAYWFTTQFMRDVVAESTAIKDGIGALEFLHERFTEEGHGMYRIGMARIDELTGELSGGHAVLATAVAPTERPSEYQIFIYDNNHPEAERAILVEAESGRWSYTAGANPDEPDTLYEGTPENQNLLYLAEAEPRLGRHPCTFCNAEDESEALAQVFGSAGAEFLVTTHEGMTVGERDGQLVSHEGAHAAPAFTTACHGCRDPHHVRVKHHPEHGNLLELRRAVHGADTEGFVSEVDAHYFGPGFAASVEGADVDLEEVHTFAINGPGNELVYGSEPSAPDDVAHLFLAWERSPTSHLGLEVRATGSEVATLSYELDTGVPVIRADGPFLAEETVIRLTRGDERGTVVVSAAVPLPSGASARILVEDSRPGELVVVEVDADSDGLFEQTLTLPELGLTTDPL
ncbi:MAG: hypothetical protein ACO3JL_03110 [Myxococcota bacterium]